MIKLKTKCEKRNKKSAKGLNWLFTQKFFKKCRGRPFGGQTPIQVLARCSDKAAEMLLIEVARL